MTEAKEQSAATEVTVEQPQQEGAASHADRLKKRGVVTQTVGALVSSFVDATSTKANERSSCTISKLF